MADIFPPDEVAKMKEAFGLLDKDGSGSIMNKDVGTALRAAGTNPSEKEVMDLVAEFGGTDDTEFDAFMDMMAKQYVVTAPTEEEIIECFKVFDQDQTGTMKVAEMKNILVSLGEKLSDEDFEAMISEVKADADGNVDYAQLTRVLLAG